MYVTDNGKAILLWKYVNWRYWYEKIPCTKLNPGRNPIRILFAIAAGADCYLDNCLSSTISFFRLAHAALTFLTIFSVLLSLSNRSTGSRSTWFLFSKCEDDPIASLSRCTSVILVNRNKSTIFAQLSFVASRMFPRELSIVIFVLNKAIDPSHGSRPTSNSYQHFNSAVRSCDLIRMYLSLARSFAIYLTFLIFITVFFAFPVKESSCTRPNLINSLRTNWRAQTSGNLLKPNKISKTGAITLKLCEFCSYWNNYPVIQLNKATTPNIFKWYNGPDKGLLSIWPT